MSAASDYANDRPYHHVPRGPIGPPKEEELPGGEPDWKAWVVQAVPFGGGKEVFKFCETEDEAKDKVSAFRGLNYTACYWDI